MITLNSVATSLAATDFLLMVTGLMPAAAERRDGLRAAAATSVGGGWPAWRGASSGMRGYQPLPEP